MKKDNYKNINITVTGGVVEVGRVPAGIRVKVIDEDCKGIGEPYINIYEGRKVKPSIGTVNVMEFNGDKKTDVASLRSFVDDQAGNKAAESLFRTLMLENCQDDCKDDESVEVALENGVYEDGFGYTLILTHSFD